MIRDNLCMLFIITYSIEGNFITTLEVFVNEFENGFEAVANILELGHELISIEIFKQEKSLFVPFEGFDSKSFTESMQSLKQQWEKILA